MSRCPLKHTNLNPQGVWNFEEGYLCIVKVNLMLVKMLETQ